MEEVDWEEEASGVRVLFATKNVSSVHVLLVANSYLLLLQYRFAETMTDNCGKCVDNLICSMGIRYVANSMQYLLLYIILFMLNLCIWP